ncbi:MAG: PsiF family protein [Pseudomonadota bacterium]
MKRLTAAVVASLFCAGLALAQDKAAAPAEKKLTPQQERMQACNKEAGDKQLKGDERKKFMKECLGGKQTAAAEAKGTAQQDRMKACNKEAGDKQLKGDERKKFMAECLKAK